MRSVGHFGNESIATRSLLFRYRTKTQSRTRQEALLRYRGCLDPLPSPDGIKWPALLVLSTGRASRWKKTQRHNISRRKIKPAFQRAAGERIRLRTRGDLAQKGSSFDCELDQAGKLRGRALQQAGRGMAQFLMATMPHTPCPLRVKL